MINETGMEYRCTQDFTIAEYDDDGYETGESIEICAGSVWTVDESGPYVTDCSGVRLSGSGGWIEISVQTFGLAFEKLEDDGTRMGQDATDEESR